MILHTYPISEREKKILEKLTRTKLCTLYLLRLRYDQIQLLPSKGHTHISNIFIVLLIITLQIIIITYFIIKYEVCYTKHHYKIRPFL